MDVGGNRPDLHWQVKADQLIMTKNKEMERSYPMKAQNDLIKLAKRLLIVGLALVILGTMFGAILQSSGGKTVVKQLSVVSDEGHAVRAQMFIPKTATKENPAPALLAVHGGNSSRSAMANYSQEFSKRGFVVISVDQSLNGKTDRGENDFNGTEIMMKYMTTLEFVDQSKIATIGHSAGGCVTNMVIDNPQFNVAACINIGVGPTFDAETKINYACIIGQHDENTGPRGKDTFVRGPVDYAKSSALKNAFGETGEEVVPLKEYGSVENHNLRIFYQPDTSHVGILYSNEGIADALEFAAYVMDLNYDIDVHDQNWIAREFSTGAVYIGIFLAAFAVLFWLLGRKKELLLENPASGHIAPKLPYWIGLVATVGIPVIGIQKFYMTGKKFFTGISQNVFAMEHINGIIFWMICTAVFVLVVNLIIKKVDKGYDWAFDKSILSVNRKEIGSYIVISICTLITAYVLVDLVGFFSDLTVKLFQSEIHTFTPTRLLTFWVYLPLYFIYYAIIGYVQTSGLLCKGQKTWSMYVRTILVSVIGPGTMVALWYFFCYTSGINHFFQWRFVLGVLLNFLPGMAIGAFLQVFIYRRTGKIWLGAIINAVLFAWMATSIGVMNVPIA